MGLAGDFNYWIDGKALYPFGSGSDPALGVWVEGVEPWPPDNVRDHEFIPNPDSLNRKCNKEAATVTIARTPDGFSFTVAGVVPDVDAVDCTGWCDRLNGTWVVEC